MDFKKLLLIAFLLVSSITACHKDLGDYEINMPLEPEVTTLDSVYAAKVGDSLIIDPGAIAPAGTNLELNWRIDVITGAAVTYTGPKLRIIFGLEAKRYKARLTVLNKANGMKYFYNFSIDGATDFNAGTAVLSLENGISQFSFIKQDGTVQARLYRAMQGKDLPANPQNLFLLKNRFTGGTMLGYWIITKNGGVRLEPNTMQEHDKYPNLLKENFFTVPDNLEVGSFVSHPLGVMMGVVTGSFYGGTTSTWDQAGTYGMFGLPALGDYELASSFVMAVTDPGTYFIAFERNKKQFVRINLYGNPAYFGNQYSVDPKLLSIFDPMNVGMELIKLIQINNNDCYAYMKATDSKIYELKFNVSFTGPFSITPQHKREFMRQDLITEGSQWQAAKNGVVYISSGAKVYKYNPINQDIRELATDFGGKTVSMIKLSDNEEQLIVGTEGTLWYTNIDAGENGSFIKKSEGIPGTPIDIAIR